MVRSSLLLSDYAQVGLRSLRAVVDVAETDRTQTRDLALGFGQSDMAGDD
jgi:hypothetical protein